MINPFVHFFNPTKPGEIAFTVGFTLACAVLALSLPFWIMAARDSYLWHKEQARKKLELMSRIFGESGAVIETK